MSTLVLKLAGMWQSYGVDGHYDERRTRREPTKSAVVGMLAAALGRKRSEDISDLAALRYGSLTISPGVVETDYHTAHSWPERDFKYEMSKPKVTHRDYLADSVFYSGLESEDHELLDRLAYALDHPVYSLFLGRKSCVPNPDLVQGVVDGDLETVLTGLADGKRCSLCLESGSGHPIEDEVDDQPITFDGFERKMAPRGVYHKWTETPEPELFRDDENF